MSPPCQSNDAISPPTNESNDSIFRNVPKNNQPKGSSGCEHTYAAASKPVEVDEPEVVELEEQEPELEVAEPEEKEPSQEDEAVQASELSAFLSCKAAHPQEFHDVDGVKEIDFEYDYEIHTGDSVDVKSAVSRFEIGLLEAVADEFNLSSCEELRRRSLRNGRNLAGTSSVIGVGSEPQDEEDTVHTDCVVSIDDSINSSSCTPMKGMMTAWVYESNERRLSESNIYSIIEAFSDDYKKNGVLAVSYIGTRPYAADVPFIDKVTKDDGQRDDLASSSSTMAPGAIAGIAVASIVALIAVLALVAKKRRDRKSAKDSEASRKIVDDALFMIDDDEEMKVVADDTSIKSSVHTEDHTYDETLPSSATFESEGEPDDEAGFEVKI